MASNNHTSNSTNLVVRVAELAQYSAYSLFGSLSVLINAFFIAIVFKVPRLRQRSDILIYCGLLFADGILSMGLLLHGLRRINLLLTSYPVPVSGWYCMQTIGETPTVFGTLVAPLMYLMVSGDRLYCVYSRTNYPESSRLYAWLLITVPFLMTSFVIAIGWFLSSKLANENLVSSLCFTDYAFPQLFNVTIYVTEASVGLLSCILYSLVLVLVKVRSSQPGHVSGFISGTVGPSGLLTARMKMRQSRVTRTLTQIMVIQFVFSVLPSILKAGSNFVPITSPLYVGISPYFGLMAVFNSIFNAALYWAKQNDMKTLSLVIVRKVCGGWRTIRKKKNLVNPIFSPRPGAKI